MNASTDNPTDIQALNDQLTAIERDSEAFESGLTDEIAQWKPSATAWSINECFDHLAITNRIYLDTMRPIAIRAREQGRRRRGPAQPGFIGRWFARSLEPPVKPNFKMKAPRIIIPQTQPAQSHTAIYAAFLDTHHAVDVFLRENADLDLAGVRFRNPFVKALRFSLATGLHVIAAHERRHLWQARQTRTSAEHRSRPVIHPDFASSRSTL
jgi:hypothetical protein